MLDMVKELLFEFLDITMHQWAVLLRELFSPDLDFITKFMTFLCLASLAYEGLYLICHRAI